MAGLVVAMIGQRDLPATYGGVERHVEEVAARLHDRGHRVTAFTSDHAGPREHRGVRLRPVAGLHTKHLDTISHSLVSSMCAARAKFDVVHMHSLAPGLVAPVIRTFSRARVVQTVHGLDDERAKFNPMARRVLRLAQWMSSRVPDATLTDAEWLAEHYRRRWGREVRVALNGVTPVERVPRSVVADLVGDGSEAGGSTPYVLFVGRFVPEKNVHVLVEAWRSVAGDVRLVLVGGSAHTDRYAARVRRAAVDQPRVVLAGNVYGRRLAALYAHAAAFTLPSTVEGLPLVLIDAAAHGLPLVCSDIPAHREVLGDDGPGHRLVPPDDPTALAAALESTITDLPDAQRGAHLTQAAVLDRHDWERTTDVVEQTYRRVLARQRLA
jgi:glycosyltransferase involved in cell wall biosynthesis